jgi:hypothetical protein
VISKSVSLAGLAMRMFALLFASCNEQKQNYYKRTVRWS